MTGRQSEQEKIKVGIIGLGKMGILHMGILNNLSGVEIRGVTESQGLILSAFKKLMPPTIATYKDYKHMISKEDLDLVFITTSTSSHTKIARDCVDKGLHFFVEKPLGLSVADCTPLLDTVKQASSVNMVGYCSRFFYTFQKAKEILDSGVLGNIYYINSFIYVSQVFSRGTGWRYKKETSGGGALTTIGTHLVDILLWFFGDIEMVCCNTKSVYSKGVEDFAHAYLLFESGLEGYMDTSWSIRNYRLPEVRIELHGENGTLIVNEDYVKFSLDKEGNWTQYYKQDLYQGVDFDLGGQQYTLQDKYLIECIRSSRQPESDVLNGYKVQKVIEAMYRSASEKRCTGVE